MADKKGSATKEKPKKKGGFKLILMMTFMGCLVPFGMPTLIVSLGLIPTLVALFTDTDANRSGVATIGYMNLAGVLPFLVDLWMKGQTMDVAMAIMREPATWAIMFGAAGVGHLILYAVPQAVAFMVMMQQESRLKTLREAIQQLEAIWGPDVGNVLPLEIVRQHKGAE